MTDEELIARLRSVHTSADDEAAADRIEALLAENKRDGERAAALMVHHFQRAEALVKERDQWIEHTKNAVWSDSEELKLANARAERLEAAVRFYARRGVVSPWVDDEINEDGGDIARAALKGEEG